MKALPSTHANNPQDLVVCRYGSRYWAVCQGAELIAVTLYKKGALRVAQLLTTTQTVAEKPRQPSRCLPPRL